MSAGIPHTPDANTVFPSAAIPMHNSRNPQKSRAISFRPAATVKASNTNACYFSGNLLKTLDTDAEVALNYQYNDLCRMIRGYQSTSVTATGIRNLKKSQQTVKSRAASRSRAVSKTKTKNFVSCAKTFSQGKNAKQFVKPKSSKGGRGYVATCV